jgi:nicotinamidase-related amidase
MARGKKHTAEQIVNLLRQVEVAYGGASREAHDMAVERMLQAGARPITTWVYVSELQRDWARAATAEKVTKLFAQRGGAFGQGLLCEWDLLDLKEGTR